MGLPRPQPLTLLLSAAKLAGWHRESVGCDSERKLLSLLIEAGTFSRWLAAHWQLGLGLPIQKRVCLSGPQDRSWSFWVPGAGYEDGAAHR